MSILDDIRRHGSWMITIRPRQFAKERIAYDQLESFVGNHVVQFRGWDFPHIDRRQQFMLGDDWIGQDFSWQDYREAWRCFQSAQFRYEGAFNIDWQGSATYGHRQVREPGTVLGIGDAAIRYAEFLRFARGMVLAVPQVDSWFVQVIARNLEGRQLIVDSPRRMQFSYARVSSMRDFAREVTMATPELVAKSDELSIDWAQALFQRFGWSVPREIVLELMKEAGWRA